MKIAIVVSISVILAVASLAVLADQGPAGAQDPAIAAQKADLPGGLEEMLRMALARNPDVVLAQAKLEEARAALNQARLGVAQSVAQLATERAQRKEHREQKSAMLARLRQLEKSGQVPASEVSAAVVSLADADAALAKAESGLRYALGMGGAPDLKAPTPQPAATAPAPSRPAPPPSRPAIPDALGELLDKPTTVAFQETPLAEVVKSLQDSTDGALPFVMAEEAEDQEAAVTLELPRAVPLRSAMLALTDRLRECEIVFLFREYGVLVTTRDYARSLAGPTIPSGVEYRGDE